MSTPRNEPPLSVYVIIVAWLLLGWAFLIRWHRQVNVQLDQTLQSRRELLEENRRLLEEQQRILDDQIQAIKRDEEAIRP